MTNAAELFHSRRSRLHRASAAAAAAAAAAATSAVDQGFGYDHSPADRGLHPRRHHHHHAYRHDLDGCDPLRRSPHVRLRGSHSERVSNWVGHGTSSSGNSMNVHPPSSVRRPDISSSERLPGSVLLARERLLERLRGVSLSGNRRSSRESSSTNHQENMYDDRWRLADISDWGFETSMQSSTLSSHVIGLSLPPEPIATTSMKKPPGLSQDAIDHLHQEFFGCADKGARGFVDGVKRECCICLEIFMEGDRLTCLPCEHKFHSACLVPWVRACGDCPYCREAITVSTSQTR
ncbi:hypothetical protein ACJRO7_034640 [Eucalyptus globulus]|uniref:RING-type domain-containing protein n=1 Tax=Eucalyptus globulus TaxID=34317 RepID=A0ABD3J7C7_EUCGL